MAKNKRQPWEIERDRAEIAQILARYRNITHKRIADLLHARRVAERKQELKELDARDDDPAVPNLPVAPYTLTRQMIDYDVNAIREQWREAYRRDFDDHLSEQLAAAYDLHTLAHEGYERSQANQDEMSRETQTVELKTNLGDVIGQVGAQGHHLTSLAGKVLKNNVTLRGAQKVKERRKRAQRDGDPRFLLVADRAQDRIDNLLGLKAATRIKVEADPRSALASLLGVPPEELPAPDGSAE